MKNTKSLLLVLTLVFTATAHAEYPEVRDIENSTHSAGVQNKIKAGREFRQQGEFKKSNDEYRAAAQQHADEQRRASNTYKLINDLAFQ